MLFKNLCTPALIYIIFSLTQIILDISEELYAVAMVKLSIGVIFTLLLNSLCENGLDVVSWFIVFVPFLLKSVVVGFLITSFGIDPYTGRVFPASPSEPEELPDIREEQALLNKRMEDALDAANVKVTTSTSVDDAVQGENAMSNTCSLVGASTLTGATDVNNDESCPCGDQVETEQSATNGGSEATSSEGESNETPQASASDATTPDMPPTAAENVPQGETCPCANDTSANVESFMNYNHL